MSVPDKIRKMRRTVAAMTLIAVGLYLLLLDIPSVPLRLILSACVLISVLAMWLAGSPSRLVAGVHHLVFSLFTLVCFFGVFELVARERPAMVPGALRHYLSHDDISKIREAMVEYLKISPFVKFKPDTTIRNQGYHGRPGEFIYEWQTDQNGFRNSRSIAEAGKAKIVLLGDSVTEGFGVADDQTLAAQLIRKGHLTYSLGVQGYAPTQMAGAFEQFGKAFNPEIVVIGYTAKTYFRERFYFDVEKMIRDQRFTNAGIQQILAADRKYVGRHGEIRVQGRYVVTACYLAAYDLANKWFHLVRNRRTLITVGGEGQQMEEVESGSPEWTSTLASFERIIAEARAGGARPVLVYLPRREEVYFRRQTGNPLPARNLAAVESAHLRRFAEERGIDYVDPTQKLLAYVAALDESAPPGDWPYLHVDDHPSAKGYELFAEAIIEHIKGASHDGEGGS